MDNVDEQRAIILENLTRALALRNQLTAEGEPLRQAVLADPRSACLHQMWRHAQAVLLLNEQTISQLLRDLSALDADPDWI
jgi:hypothetical protein